MIIKNNIAIPKVIKLKFIKGEIAISTVIVAVGCLLAPPVGIGYLLYKLFQYGKLKRITKVKEVFNDSITEELLWVIVAIAASAVVPFPLGLILIIWRVLMVAKEIKKKEGV